MTVYIFKNNYCSDIQQVKITMFLKSISNKVATTKIGEWDILISSIGVDTFRLNQKIILNICLLFL